MEIIFYPDGRIEKWTNGVPFHVTVEIPDGTAAYFETSDSSGWLTYVFISWPITPVIFQGTQEEMNILKAKLLLIKD